MKRHLAALVFVLEVTIPGAVPAQVIERDVAIVTRDGVKLAADVIRPAGAGPFPTLVYRTPYSRRGTFEGGTVRAAVGRGYAVVVQDVRGRYGSAGEFVPYVNEGKDGYDTIEWAAAQSWSNGKVGTFGLSYPGAVQWLAAVESPPHLAAMVPAMTFSTSRNFIYSGGVFDGSWTTWTWNNIAPDVRVRKNLPGPCTGEAARAAWDEQRDSVQKRLPLTNLPEFKDVAPWLTQWMLVPPGDARWDWMEIRGKYDKVKAAVLNISGWHDEAYGPEGAITNYLGLLQSRRGQDPRTTLVLGPWIHGGPMSRDSKRQESSGDRSFGPAAAIDYDALVLDFMDRYLKPAPSIAAPAPAPVRVFVMGENAWRDAPSWPPPSSAEPLQLFLSGAPKGERSGRLAPTRVAGSPASKFVSDPMNPVADPFALESGAHDYRDLVKRSDLLVFETEPFAAETRVVGPIDARIFVSSDAPDLDLWVKLFDVAPDGTAWNLMSPGLDVLRASYRDGGPERKLLKPGDIYELRFADLVTGNQFKKGHRLRAVLTPSFFPHFSRNLHTGELETTSAAARTATITVHHDNAHPSRLVVPVLR